MDSPLADGAAPIVARSPDLDASTIEVVVVLPTFRRPHQVLDTLASLSAQATSRRFAVILVENETKLREGAAAATPVFDRGGLAGLIVVAHERGNCSAYNAGFATALTQFPAFSHLLVIDDDERAEPGWIDAMIAASQRLDADILGGPQIPVFAPGTPRRFQSHPVFAPPFRQSGRVPALYSSGNLAIRRRVLAEMPAPHLDTRFNFLGGGDADFLSRAAERGYRLGWCAEARVSETVPPQRMSFAWVNRRALRNGVISTLVERRRRARQTTGGLRTAAKSLALLAASPLRAVKTLALTRSPDAALYPIQVGLGRVLAHFGYEHEQYRNPEQN